MTSLTRIQDEKTLNIKSYSINGVDVSESKYNAKFDELNNGKNYNSSATKRNIKTGDYVHTCTFS